MNTKTCSHCKEDKPLEAFTFRSKEKKTLQSRCKLCASEAAKMSQAKIPAEEHNARIKAYLQTPKGATSRIKTKARQLGLSEEEVQKVGDAFIASNGTCDICHKNPKEAGTKHGLYIDHCHDKNVFRGLLCIRCNTMLGCALDNANILAEGVKYLER